MLTTLIALAAATTTPQSKPADPCAGSSRNEADACADRYLAQATAELERYTAAARGEAEEMVQVDNEDLPVERFRPATLSDFDKAAEAWPVYRDAECQALEDQWGTGTGAGAAATACMTRLTRLRTHTIWQDWLHPDDGKDILSEPAREGPVG